VPLSCFFEAVFARFGRGPWAGQARGGKNVVRLPKQRTNADNAVRKVGYELEFAGLGIREACDVVQATLGGTVHEVNRFAYIVKDSEVGTINIEYDAIALKERSYLKYLQAIGLEASPRLVRDVDEFLARASAGLVPCEIVLPPLEMTRMEPVERLRAALQQAKAKGTRTSLLHAFGLHINVEPPALDVDTLTAYMQAFVLMEDWLRRQGQVDISRVLSPYINGFPQAYVRLVADPGYAPRDQAEWIHDYLAHNATRNRSLDMLPLLAHLDRERVLAGGVEQELLKPRPAFHYRLPNCLVDEPDWRVGHEWEQWLRVEAMAADHVARASMGLEYLDYVSSPLRRLEESWVAISEQWIRGLAHE
jgi:hypothetical protein